MNGLFAYWEIPLYEYTGQDASFYVKFIMFRDLTRFFESLLTSMSTGAVVIYHGSPVLEGEEANDDDDIE